MADDTTVSIAVAWSERGQDVPRRTTAELRNLTRAASETGATIDTRMATAFERLERREPTMVLRRSVMALEGLAASSLGAEGAFAKLAGSMLLLGSGTGTGLAIIAGIAAIGEGYKLLSARAREASEETKKLHEAVLKLATETPQARQAERWKQIAQAQTELAQAQRELAKEERHAATPLIKFHPDSPVAQGVLANIEKLRLKIIELKEALVGLQDPGTMKPLEIIAHAQPGRLPTWVTEGILDRRDVTHFPVSLRSRPFGMPFDSAGRVTAEQAPQKAQSEATGKALAAELAPLIGGAVGLLATVAQGGGAGAAISGLGGLASGLASSGLISTLKGSLGAALGPIGIGLSAVGGILGLFGGGGQKPKIIIDGYSSDALTQQEQVMLATLGFRGVVFETLGAGRSSDKVAYDLAARARLDAVPRVPPGARGG